MEEEQLVSKTEAPKIRPRRSFIQKLEFTGMSLFIVTIFLLYVFVHIHPLLQLDLPQNHRIEKKVTRGLIQLLLLLTTTVLLLVSFLRTTMAGPGFVVDFPEFHAKTEDVPRASYMDVERPKRVSSKMTERRKNVETKLDGSVRVCNKCPTPVYKPDRAHHCHVCNTCVLKMYHHCHGLGTCIGFNNYKYFFLVLFYTCLSFAIIAVTMWHHYVEMLTNKNFFIDFKIGLIYLVLETFAIAAGAVFFFYLLLQSWIIVRGMTTIESMEKTSLLNFSVWNISLKRNIQDALGPNMALWLLPCSPPAGAGISFLHRLKKD